MSKDKRKSEARADEAVRRAAGFGIGVNCKWGWAYYDERIQAAMKRGWLKLVRHRGGVRKYGGRNISVMQLTESGQRRFEWITRSKES